MKKNRLALIITSIVIVCFDVLSLLLRKDFNSNFWFGFAFVQLALIIYIVLSLLINESSDGQRGIKPLEFMCISNIIVMLIMAIIYYAIPKVENIRLLIVPYVILYALMGIGVALGLYNKKVIEQNDKIKKQI